MIDKFKYAPGMPGFGTKGSDGSLGNQGLAMYFTDLDPVGGKGALETKISNNQVLWFDSINPLPDDRKYITGDLFFDSDGKAYEINAETDTFSSIGGNLNMGGFFIPLEIKADNGFQRFFNSNSSPKYIIDNIYTDAGTINYTESPVTIYNINPRNFARIEYSNVVLNQKYNPFTVYSGDSSAELPSNQKSIAIVRDISLNLFRIGNLDDAGNLRNVNLIFDVSSLIHTKQPGNTFTGKTPPGSILTNYEIAANILFDPEFNSNPGIFSANRIDNYTIKLVWYLSEFMNSYPKDPTIKGDLYFFENLNLNNSTFRIDSSAARPLIFSDIEPSGEIYINDISSTKSYGYYMKLSKNGWTRNSIIKYV